jgi:gamma-glutamyltranspeptidase/glutathione hydrolase
MHQDDLAAHTSQWVDPLSVRYRGAEVFQCPPNSQGVATLIALDIASRHDMTNVPPGSPDWFEIMVAAARSGMRVAIDNVADPATTRPIRLSGHSTISAVPRLEAGSGRSGGGDTAYVGVIDADGNGCSMISSLYDDFGSGLVVPGTGIVLNNRGSLFDVDARSPNVLAPGKLPYHTIMPCLASENGSLAAILGVVGGFQQPQAQLQILSYLLDYRLHPQEALDRPRFRIDLPSSERVLLEEGIPELVRHRLAAYAPRYVHGWDRIMFGGAQALTKDANTIGAGSDLRSEGRVAGW